MLKLRRSGSITCNSCPIIRPSLVLIATQANHGLDGEGHAFSAFADSFVFSIVRHIRRTVKQGVDSMPAVCLDDGQLLVLGVLLDDIAEFLDGNSGFDVIDGFGKALPSGLYEPDIVRIGFGFVSNIVSLVQITVISFVEKRNVDVQNVAILQHSLVWDTMADNFIR